MMCLNCGSPKLIKAHLIPRVFAVEVKSGKSLASGVISGDRFEITQSGAWDRDILCGVCDGILGEYENYAFQISRLVRFRKNTFPWQQWVHNDVDSEKILKFCAGILYKYSLTSKKNGKITLGRYQELLKHFIFTPGAGCPPELDALIIRPLRFPNDDGVFAYRAPSDDRQHGLNCYRMMMGGIIFFVFLDSRGTGLHSAREDFIGANPGTLKVTTVDARTYEEFTKPARFANEGRLSDYLDRVERQT